MMRVLRVMNESSRTELLRSVLYPLRDFPENLQHYLQVLETPDRKPDEDLSLPTEQFQHLN